MKSVVLALLVSLICPALACGYAGIAETSEPQTIIYGLTNNAYSLSKDQIVQTGQFIQADQHFTFKLPASLQVIEDEAFEGTAIVDVDLQGMVQYIGDHAFAGIPALRRVRIPEATTYISNSAFAGSHRVMITSPLDSYARVWAKANGVPFTPIAALQAANAQANSAVRLQSRRDTVDTASNYQNEDQESLDCRWFVNTDQTILHNNLFAHHISSRAPPAAM